jgi:hypothetical protein
MEEGPPQRPLHVPALFQESDPRFPFWSIETRTFGVPSHFVSSAPEEDAQPFAVEPQVPTGTR